MPGYIVLLVTRRSGKKTMLGAIEKTGYGQTTAPTAVQKCEVAKNEQKKQLQVISCLGWDRSAVL